MRRRSAAPLARRSRRAEYWHRRFERELVEGRASGALDEDDEDYLLDQMAGLWRLMSRAARQRADARAKGGAR